MCDYQPSVDHSTNHEEANKERAYRTQNTVR